MENDRPGAENSLPSVVSITDPYLVSCGDGDFAESVGGCI